MFSWLTGRTATKKARPQRRGELPLDRRVELLEEELDYLRQDLVKLRGKLTGGTRGDPRAPQLVETSDDELELSDEEYNAVIELRRLKRGA